MALQARGHFKPYHTEECVGEKMNRSGESGSNGLISKAEMAAALEANRAAKEVPRAANQKAHLFSTNHKEAL